MYSISYMIYVKKVIWFTRSDESFFSCFATDLFLFWISGPRRLRETRSERPAVSQLVFQFPVLFPPVPGYL